MTPKKSQPIKKSDATRAHLFATALKLFRKDGFEETTMRKIAEEAGLSLGAAYYYFRSKDEIVLEYYADTQREQAKIAEAALDGGSPLRERIGLVLHGKLDQLAKDRRLIGALLGKMLSSDSKIAFLADETTAIRRQSLDNFRRVLEPEAFADDVKDLVAMCAFVLHLALGLMIVRDKSPKQQRSHDLADEALDLILPILPLVANDAFGAPRARVLELARSFFGV